MAAPAGGSRPAGQCDRRPVAGGKPRPGVALRRWTDQDEGVINDRPPRLAGEEAAGPPLAGPRPGRRMLRDELLLVLVLSLLSAAAYSVLSLVEAPIRGETVSLFADRGLAFQLLGVVTDLVPVLLVFHFLARSGERPSSIGLDLSRPRADLLQGVVLSALVGSVGVALYVASYKLGLNRGILPVPPRDAWWTVLVLLLGALRAGIVEEVIVCGYLLRRLAQLGWRPGTALAASALLRASYHLYQGWGAFAGNLAMGLLFGRIYQSRGRTTPLVIAHFLLDAAAGLGWLALRGHVDWLPK
jgi:membrane protease YdiL (CAAX protease family)